MQIRNTKTNKVWKVNILSTIITFIMLGLIFFIIWVVMNFKDPALQIGDQLIILSIWTFLGFYIINNTTWVSEVKVGNK